MKSIRRYFPLAMFEAFHLWLGMYCTFALLVWKTGPHLLLVRLLVGAVGLFILVLVYGMFFRKSWGWNLLQKYLLVVSLNETISIWSAFLHYMEDRDIDDEFFAAARK